MRPIAAVLTVVAVVVVAAFCRVASASPPYPGIIGQHLNLSYEPPCSICHQNGVTGYGTVTTPFGEAMRGAGLQAGDPAGLGAALDQLAADGVDSDGDGVSDIEELKAATDPNGTGSLGSSRVPQPAYGCGATIAPSRPRRGSGAAFAGVALSLLAGASVRRRRTLAALAFGLGGAVLLAACYDVSYVSTDTCSSGVMWTGGDSGSPAMNPGLACLNCHAQGNGPAFAFAGTVFANSSEEGRCFGSPDARVIVYGADGRSVEMLTNEAGNFYSGLHVGLPYTAAVFVGDGQNVMTTPQTSGDCNGCHKAHGANGAPGRVVEP